MCFRLYYTGKKPLPKKAKEDIIVWKVISKEGWGWMNNLKIDGKEEKWEKGWHYIELKPFIRSTVAHSTLKVNGNAFHSNKTRRLGRGKVFYGNKLVRMYIPKGALYYENDTEYVSSEIVYPK
jgi:hypothetical protein